MATENNIQTLTEFYNKQVARQKKGTKNIYRNILMMLFLNVITFFMIMAMTATATDLDMDDKMPMVWLSLLSLVIPIIGTYIYFSSRSELKSRISETIEDCKPLSREEYGDLYKLCDDILQEMELKNVKYQVLYLGSDQYFPGILEHEGVSYLIITRNFLSLIYKKPEQARALIFHEFGHVLQEDSNNFLFNTILTKKAMVLGVIMLITIIAGLAFGRFAVSLVSIIGIMSFFALKAGRLESEVLADLNAVIHRKGNDLVAVLQEYAVEDPAERATHLPPQQRIKKLEEFMTKYNINTPAQAAQA